jgi:hypothetical protein
MRLIEIKNIFEGGAATSKWGTGRIKKQDIPPTLDFVSNITGIPAKDLHPLGSVGKMPTSGDIDLAIDSKKYNTEELHQKLMQHVDGQGVFNKGTKVGSYAIPIAGDPSKGKVQLDFMPTGNIGYSKFAYHSPGTKSKYKGVARTILLMAVTSSLFEEGTDHATIDPKTGELTIRAGRTLDLTQGIRRIFQHRPKKKSGEGYLKNMKSIPIEKFKELFPDIEVANGNIVIDDPQQIVEMLFGKGLRPRDVGSAEQVIELIKTRYSEEKQKDIFDRTIKRMNSAKMDIPEEMQEFANVT